MTSLKHGVNLSRRACRHLVTLLAAGILLASASGNPIEVNDIQWSLFAPLPIIHHAGLVQIGRLQKRKACRIKARRDSRIFNARKRRVLDT
ncbi:jg22750 [Pararge aegeria aegeria]|uniref:Jg22750 protein n=1 Tax=Pararge aegeria aegeria TaxID=348720 RepID=A0A8S4RYL5_9NEOP|nr:jg22750 [Pararge aegeria aegeria]